MKQEDLDRLKELRAKKVLTEKEEAQMEQPSLFDLLEEEGI